MTRDEGPCWKLLVVLTLHGVLIEQIEQSVIGRFETVDGPFGVCPVVYADYTASGRALSFIEDYITSVVLPTYANTHSESSGTGLQTARFREEARQLVANGVGATEEHAVLFCGSGSTAAIMKLVDVLGIRLPSNLEDRHHIDQHIPMASRPVVFIGPYEHHSNELPWRESIATVITIDEDANGHVDLEHLEAELQRFRKRPLLIGSFSAASNVTGITTDVAAVSTLLHRFGGLAFWDYAAAAPYVDMAMGSRDEGLGYLDAVFISPHKFIGGPGTPGVLVARRELFTNRVPAAPGGGTVAYVNAQGHDYLPDIEAREEGGTPDIVGAIRAGLVFQLKEAVGNDTIKAREADLVQRAVGEWGEHPDMQLLGNPTADRLSIVSFVVRDVTAPDAEPARFVHHNLVVAILNDLFGIQSRGGCSCAGPYGHRLLGIDLAQSREFEREILRGCEGIKPGWVRVNFNYFIDDDTADYIVQAVKLVAENAASLLPLYRFEPDSGLWRHRDGAAAAPCSLNDISYESGVMTYPDIGVGNAVSFADQLERAQRIIAAQRLARTEPLHPPDTNPDFEALRWFPYPADASV